MIKAAISAFSFCQAVEVTVFADKRPIHPLLDKAMLVIKQTTVLGGSCKILVSNLTVNAMAEINIAPEENVTEIPAVFMVAVKDLQAVASALSKRLKKTADEVETFDVQINIDIDAKTFAFSKGNFSTCVAITAEVIEFPTYAFEAFDSCDTDSLDKLLMAASAFKKALKTMFPFVQKEKNKHELNRIYINAVRGGLLTDGATTFSAVDGFSAGLLTYQPTFGETKSFSLCLETAKKLEKTLSRHTKTVQFMRANDMLIITPTVKNVVTNIIVFQVGEINEWGFNQRKEVAKMLENPRKTVEVDITELIDAVSLASRNSHHELVLIDFALPSTSPESGSFYSSVLKVNSFVLVSHADLAVRLKEQTEIKVPVDVEYNENRPLNPLCDRDENLNVLAIDSKRFIPCLMAASKITSKIYFSVSTGTSSFSLHGDSQKSSKQGDITEQWEFASMLMPVTIQEHF